MKNKTPIVITLIIALTLCFLPQPALANTQNDTPALIAKLLEQSGYTFTKAADNVWTVAFRGKELPDFKVAVTSQEGIVVMFAIVAVKKDLKVTPELMAKLLKLNSDLDRVKVGIDGEGDTFVRVDLSARVTDVPELKTNLEQVAAAADVVFAAIKPNLTTVK